MIYLYDYWSGNLNVNKANQSAIAQQILDFITRINGLIEGNEEDITASYAESVKKFFSDLGEAIPEWWD